MHILIFEPAPTLFLIIKLDGINKELLASMAAKKRKHTLDPLLHPFVHVLEPSLVGQTLQQHVQPIEWI